MTLDAFFAEARELGAEVVVVDGSGGRALPPGAQERYPGIRSVDIPGGWTFRLRWEGLRAARGDVVLITEDHCRPRPGWVRAHLEAHREHPEASEVGGPVENGADRQLIDWASFLVGHIQGMQPTQTGEGAELDRANISYKRRAVPTEPDPDGFAEPFIDEELAKRGERWWADPRPVLDHVQPLGWRGTLPIQFHAGRSMAGGRVLQGLSPLLRLRGVARSFFLAPFLVARATAVLRAKGRLRGRPLASLPALFALGSVIGAGLLAGYVAGPGNSAPNLR
jgi:hypothetical protein